MWSKYLTEDARDDERLNEEHLDAQIAQIRLARSITRISPASSVRYAIESLAGTGFTRHIQFLKRVRRYADEFRAFLVGADRADPESPHAIGPKEGTSQKSVRFESIPKFEDHISRSWVPITPQLQTSCYCSYFSQYCSRVRFFRSSVLTFRGFSLNK